MPVTDGRPEFARWVDSKSYPEDWKLLPITHITRGLKSDDILRSGKIKASYCDILEASFAFFFYGRPAYRASSDKVVNLEVSCPYCFLFDPDLVTRANKFYAFDTGAFGSRLYSHVLDEDFSVEDYSLSNDPDRLNKLIAAVFPDQISYFAGDRSKIAESSELAQPHEFAAKSYVELLKSPGRNEPDDRICSIEVLFADPVVIQGSLLAVVVPHTIFDSRKDNEYISALENDKVDIIPYEFIPGRHPEHYQTLLEARVKEYYCERGFL